MQIIYTVEKGSPPDHIRLQNLDLAHISVVLQLHNHVNIKYSLIYVSHAVKRHG